VSLLIEDFDFDLPASLIAQRPPPERGTSRLLVLRRDTGAIEHTHIDRLPDYLRAGDLLVVNDTRVMPARLLGRRVPSGGAVECLLLGRLAPDTGQGEEWDALMHPGQKLRPGARVLFEGHGLRLLGEVLAQRFHGRRTIRLGVEGGAGGDDVGSVVERLGHIPLPPYIDRPDEASDRERYQTVYARETGSVAAPTAGLHFTPGLLDALAVRGVERAAVTLHVGYGTFKPVRVERVEAHEVDPERYVVPPVTADALTRARREGRRVVAVGTTTTRALESLALEADGTVRPASGETRLFIHPGHRFGLVNALMTNFHLPRSSLLMLAAAVAGREALLAAYREAVGRGYRFYSYGDVMLIV
jgi:S-adenosylmethionine:tRNA ribosyltransferase-isomerase